jgi:predicted dehydrogenase
MTTQDLNTTTADRKIRYAVVGLGWFAQAAALPAFANTDNSEVVALVSDDPTKRTEVATKYGIDQSQTYTYTQYDDLLHSGTIDAVYIAVPNQLHCDYTVRAARAGIHILCEKPMAVTPDECEQMIAAAQDRQVKFISMLPICKQSKSSTPVKSARRAFLTRSLPSKLKAQIAG